MRGRPRKPTALRILEGNRGKRPLPKDEPVPTGHAVKPTWVKGRAAKFWAEYAPRFEQLGTLTDADETEFGRWCVLMAQLVADSDDFPAGLHARLDALAGKFGMDPSSRARLGGLGKKPKKNAFAELTA